MTIKGYSATKGLILDVPLPSKREMKKWKPLIDLAFQAVLTQPSRDNNINKKKMITVKWSKTVQPPEGFPIGRTVKGLDKRFVREYNPETVLLWFYQRRYCTYSPNMVYQYRQAAINSLTRYENSVDNILDNVYNEVIDNFGDE